MVTLRIHPQFGAARPDPRGDAVHQVGSRQRVDPTTVPQPHGNQTDVDPPFADLQR
ncbi:hypothetical protein SAMN05216489_05041 [Streptomyces sp. 3213]|uniref:hypothetical protein n=1 Tax=Streptomyces sp. 3213.3 TaxID=1855348 RepID=UPI0008988A2F|nr:hypothetical protein [Streptomyces sp. 3213.3]SED95816.1 hypothetical protein SAMN05216489_05041 [Streptomyces sp. 3213] [Streptomyces sp. 3213.3]